MTAIIRWENPPGAAHADMIVEALKERPGQWALVHEGLDRERAYTQAGGLRRCGAKARVSSPDGRRQNGSSTRNVWACWPAVDSEPAPE